jgi:hypothetical protein
MTSQINLGWKSKSLFRLLENIRSKIGWIFEDKKPELFISTMTTFEIYEEQQDQDIQKIN